MMIILALPRLSLGRYAPRHLHHGDDGEGWLLSRLVPTQGRSPCLIWAKLLHGQVLHGEIPDQGIGGGSTIAVVQHVSAPPRQCAPSGMVNHSYHPDLGHRHPHHPATPTPSNHLALLCGRVPPCARSLITTPASGGANAPPWLETGQGDTIQALPVGWKLANGTPRLPAAHDHPITHRRAPTTAMVTPPPVHPLPAAHGAHGRDR
jgi:hypothetical protein